MQQQSKPKGFGGRGWILIFWVATACFAYVLCGNYPLNILADLYGGAQVISKIYTGASIVAIIVQVTLSRKAGAIKSWKKLSVILGIATLICQALVMLLTPGVPWLICYGLATAFSVLYGTWAVYVLVGSWFPTRKGTVMGIVTFAFPIGGNMLVGGFASKFFALIGSGSSPQGAAFSSLWPYTLVVLVGLIIGAIFITDFPEQVGAYRDNDKNMTPEIANAMMKEEEENRKTTVWTTGHTFASPDFWFITLAMGILLMFSVGIMTQTNAIITPYEESLSWIGGFTGVNYIIGACGIIGSYFFGLVDTKKGTRFAVSLALCFQIAAGILGALGNAITLFIAFILLGLFMGASSNFTVSCAVQYWRQEDFPSVFTGINPIANLINCLGPTVVAALYGSTLGVHAVFIACGIVAIIGLILSVLFKPSRIKAYDDKYRLAAGKPLDDALVGRK